MSATKTLADHYANYPDMVGMFKKRIEIIRNARRYLALREAWGADGECRITSNWYPMVIGRSRRPAAGGRGTRP